MSDPKEVTNDLEAFLTWWYGQPAVRPVVVEGLAPYPMRHWYACAGAWSHPLTHQNFVRPLQQLVSDDGATVFYDENQPRALGATAGAGTLRSRTGKTTPGVRGSRSESCSAPSSATLRYLKQHSLFPPLARFRVRHSSSSTTAWHGSSWRRSSPGSGRLPTAGST